MSFTLPEAGHAVVAIYDARGMEVARLVDQTLAPGPHTVDWNGRDAYGASMPSGTYFCRLTTADSVMTRKLQLVR
jgi:flagellar hook assembly protein FlgD